MSEKKNKQKSEKPESEDEKSDDSGNEHEEKSNGKDKDKDKSHDEGNEDGEGDGSNDDDNDEEEQSKEGDEDDVIKVERTSTSPALLSQLRHSNEYRQARGLGAGGTGAATFHVQRITALALIPLAIWFAVSMIRLSMGSRAAAVEWLAWPVNAAVMALFIIISLRHATIGVQIILEDYVHGEALRRACVLAVKAIALVIGVAVVAALIHLAV